MRNPGDYFRGSVILAFISTLVLAVSAALARPPELIRFDSEQPHMGTLFRITVYAPDAQSAQTAIRAAFARVKALEKVMSDYDPESEAMQLCSQNDADPGKPRRISQDLEAVLAMSLKIAKLSDGAFDVTIGPLSKLWRETRKSKQLPAPEILAAAKAKVGYKNLTLNPEARTLTMRIPGMRLDFGGIGKGYAADEALAVLKKHGISSALIAASGDLTASDPPPGRESWIVAIPGISTGESQRLIRLVNASVSTSGDLFQFVEINGVRYSHVLDPRSGLGLTGRRSATVVAPGGALADSLTKAVSLLPEEKALQLIKSQKGASMYLVVKSSDSAAPTTTLSPGFRDLELPIKP